MTPPTLTNLTFRTVLRDLESHGRIHPPLIAVSPTASIRETLAVMARHKIVSVPIRARSGVVNQTYSGMVSTLDLVFHLFDPPSTNPEIVTERLNDPVETALPLLSSVSGFTDQDTKVHTRESYRIWDRDIDDTITESLQVLATGRHRMILSSIAGDKPCIFTQSDVIRFLKHNLGLLADTPNVSPTTPVGELNLHTPLLHLISISPDTIAKDAFLVLVNKLVSAIPVLDPYSGAIVAVVSGAILRGITSTALNSLDRPILEFIKSQYNDTLPVVPTCTLDTPLITVLDQLVSGSAHRVWIVSQDGRCTGLISLTDIIAWLVRL